MKIIAISDTHTRHREIMIPDCDILIHAGDYTSNGRIEETSSFLTWFAAQPAEFKVFISGNHDSLSFNNSSLFKALVKEHANLFYLEDSGIEIKGLKIWGTPWTPTFGMWSYMVDPYSPRMQKYRDMIPEDLDILVSHGPPHSVCSTTQDGKEAGCIQLKFAIEKVQPKHVICGHIHEAHGTGVIGGSKVHNVASLDARYTYTHKPVEIKL